MILKHYGGNKIIISLKSINNIYIQLYILIAKNEPIRVKLKKGTRLLVNVLTHDT